MRFRAVAVLVFAAGGLVGCVPAAPDPGPTPAVDVTPTTISLDRHREKTARICERFPFMCAPQG